MIVFLFLMNEKVTEWTSIIKETILPLFVKEKRNAPVQIQI